MDCIVHGVAKSQTRLSDFHFRFADTGTHTIIIIIVHVALRHEKSNIYTFPKVGLDKDLYVEQERCRRKDEKTMWGDRKEH